MASAAGFSGITYDKAMDPISKDLEEKTNRISFIGKIALAMIRPLGKIIMQFGAAVYMSQVPLLSLGYTTMGLYDLRFIVIALPSALE